MNLVARKVVKNELYNQMIKDVETYTMKYYNGDEKYILINKINNGEFKSEVELMMYLIFTYNIQYKDCRNKLLSLYREYPSTLNYLSERNWKMSHYLMEDYFKVRKKNEVHVPKLKVPTIEFETEKTLLDCGD